MRILIISQYFYPEEFKINDLVREFVRRGHHVMVLTGKPNYPAGEYFDGYQYKGIVKENYFGAEVVRVPLRKRGRGGGKNLALNYLSYVINANRYINRNILEFDAILCFAVSPITQIYPALLCRKKYGGRVALWVLDLWPESVSAAGGVTNRLVLGALDRMVKRIYQRCDSILISSEGFRQSILSKGGLSSKIWYAPNWAEDLYIKKHIVNKESISAMMPAGFRVMFAGNVGMAQDVDSIIMAAKETIDYPEIKWVIVGDGRARSVAEEQVNNLGLNETVVFLGRHPMDEMPTFFSFADVMIVSLKDDYIFSLTVPAKIQSYMASGKPIVSMLNGEGNRILSEARCGLIASSGDYKSLANNVISMYHMSREERKKMGEDGVNYYLNNFDKNIVLESIIKAIS